MDERGSQTNDYGEWNINPTWNSVALPNPVRFQPTTTWKSTGTYAIMQLVHTPVLWTQFGEYTGTQTITVSYDY